MDNLSAWQSFYAMVGSAAGALIGLQFVVIALLASFERIKRSVEFGAVFATPNLVHFGTVLMIASASLVPWSRPSCCLACNAAIGLFGLAYTLGILRAMLRLTVYRPEMEDWAFHAALPLIAYAMLAAAWPTAWTSTWHPAVFHLPRSTGFSLSAASALLLLIIGIHNAWDNVAYHMFRD